MSQQRLPAVYKNTLANYEIQIRMGNHRRKMHELYKRKSSQQNINKTISYREMLEQNPKRNYFLQTKYTEIERENRALFERIEKYHKKLQRSKNRKSPQEKAKSCSHQQIRSLNNTFRKQQNEQIQRQNVKMFGRIQKQKPFMSFRQTDKQFANNKKMSSRLSQLQKNRIHNWY